MEMKGYVLVKERIYIARAISQSLDLIFAKAIDANQNMLKPLKPAVKPLDIMSA